MEAIRTWSPHHILQQRENAVRDQYPGVDVSLWAKKPSRSLVSRAVVLILNLVSFGIYSVYQCVTALEEAARSPEFLAAHAKRMARQEAFNNDLVGNAIIADLARRTTPHHYPMPTVQQLREFPALAMMRTDHAIHVDEGTGQVEFEYTPEENDPEWVGRPIHMLGGHGQTLFHMAVYTGDVPVLQWFVEEHKVGINCCFFPNHKEAYYRAEGVVNALMVSVRVGRPDISRYLLDHGAKMPVGEMSFEAYIETFFEEDYFDEAARLASVATLNPLYQALYDGDLRRITQLREWGAKIENHGLLPEDYVAALVRSKRLTEREGAPLIAALNQGFRNSCKAHQLTDAIKAGDIEGLEELLNSGLFVPRERRNGLIQFVELFKHTPDVQQGLIDALRR